MTIDRKRGERRNRSLDARQAGQRGLGRSRSRGGWYQQNLNQRGQWTRELLSGHSWCEGRSQEHWAGAAGGEGSSEHGRGETSRAGVMSRENVLQSPRGLSMFKTIWLYGYNYCIWGSNVLAYLLFHENSLL